MNARNPDTAITGQGLDGPMSRRGFLRRSGRTAVAVGAYSSFGAFLAACGESAETADDPQTGDAAAGGGAARDLIYLAEDVPPGLDWDGPSAALPIAQLGMEQFYGRLIKYELVPGPDDGILVPDYDSFVGELAESWEQNDLEWTFKLRQGVQSCAGNEMTADDVIWTFERAKSVSGAAPVSWFLLNVASVMTADVLAEDATDETKRIAGEIEKIDDYTVLIRQLEPNSLFLRVLGIFALPIVDSKEAQAHATDEDPWAHEWMNTQGAAGFGPYCLKSWNKAQEMVFEANESWQGEGLTTPSFKTVTLRKVPSAATRTSSLLSGAADITTNLTSRDFAQVRDEGGDEARVFGVLGNENTFLHMNFSVPPFDNIKLRQALAYAMPYDDIIQTGYLGQAQRWNGVVPPSYPGFQEITTYDTDLDRARELLAEAGYPDGQGLEEFSDALQLFYVSEKQDQLQPIATTLQTGLREIGVNIELAPIPQSQYGDRQLVRRDLPLAINDQEKPIAPDAGYAIQLFFITSEKGGLNNMVNYSNEEVDRLWLEEAKTEPDPDRRNEVLARIQEILMEDVVWLPLVIWQSQIVLRSDMTGWAYDPGNALDLAHLESA